MKNLLFTIAVALCCCNLALAEKQSVTVLKTDIHCDNCKNKILQNTDALGQGIKDVKVDLQSQIVFIEYDGDLNSEENIIKGLESLNVKAEKARPVKGAANGKPFCKMPPPEKKAQKCDKADLAKCDKKAPDCGNKADCDKTIKCDKKADCEAKASSCCAKPDCCPDMKCNK